uniref:Uncharacterized protein n=1 Tax=Arundo donax TaxID=35708 RepID=A0A0A8YQY5_ARUDO
MPTPSMCTPRTRGMDAQTLACPLLKPHGFPSPSSFCRHSAREEKHSFSPSFPFFPGNPDRAATIW